MRFFLKADEIHPDVLFRGSYKRAGYTPKGGVLYPLRGASAG